MAISQFETLEGRRTLPPSGPAGRGPARPGRLITGAVFVGASRLLKCIMNSPFSRSAMLIFYDRYINECFAIDVPRTL